MRRSVRMWSTAGLLALVLGIAPAAASVPPVPAVPDAAGEGVERDPLELRALVEPEAVLQELGPALRDATLAGDERRVALLQIARANACRVVADWECQRDAGAAAVAAAAEAAEPRLQVRGLIAEARARIALQDFSRGEQRLGEAQRLLAAHPEPELQADVMLAWSSMSFTLGKRELSADYARRGLAMLPAGTGDAMRTRLLRNLARALAESGETREAADRLAEATAIAVRLGDPKLEAELYLEAARLARQAGDIGTQRGNGERVLDLAESLRNSQLRGLGEEVLGLAAMDAGDRATAQRHLRAALDSFTRLGLERDERRVLAELLQLELAAPAARDSTLAPVVSRFLVLDAALEQADRAQAADNFDARLQYAEREFELRRLQAQTQLERERSAALARENDLSTLLNVLAVAILVLLAAFFVSQRRGTRRLREVLGRLRESEAEYRTLADNASDLVMRLRPDGRVEYASPSAREQVGLAPEDLARVLWERVHPDDLATLRAAFDRVAAGGEAETPLFRVAHSGGGHVWLEGLMRRVEGAEGEPEVLLAARNVSVRVRAEQALAAARARLSAITDNIPALITHIDRDERFAFVNAYGERVMGLDPQAILGRTVREVRGEALYATLRPWLQRAWAGETVEFDGEAEVGGRHYHFRTTYVPDRDLDGNVSGLFAFTIDTSALRAAERALDRLARVDALCDVANRRHFDERLSAAVARARRQGTPLALLLMDVDRFKQINDSRGHAGGDAVLREFARRLKASVRAGDLVARLGGDEFAVLVEGAVDAAAAESIASKLQAAMSQPILLPGGPLVVGTSIGIGLAACGELAEGERLVAAADQALYAAKDAGRGTWRTVSLG